VTVRDAHIGDMSFLLSKDNLGFSQCGACATAFSPHVTSLNGFGLSILIVLQPC
jgi:hypothetical protein